MPDRLVTVRTFYDPLDAEMAVNLLRAEGVEAFLADSKFVSTTWHLANAVQGIKLQVRPDDAEKARYFLGEVDMARSDRLADWDREPDDEDLDDEDDYDEDDYDESEDAHVLPMTGGYADDSLDDDDWPPNAAEASAERAFKGAAFGLIFVPLQFYVTLLLAEAFFSGQPMRPRYRRKARIAAGINILFLVLLSLWLRYR